MATIVSIHSFRGGTGKSNTTANVAAVLAARGRRVGVIDTDIQSPGIHVLFGLPGDEITSSLNDYLWGDGEIGQAAHDVTPQENGGRLFLIPSSTKPGEISRALREGYDAQRLTRGLRRLVDELELDVLLIDTHPGLHEETLLSLVISNMLLIVMRPDQQDYEGTGITVRVAQGLEVPRMMLLVNKTPESLDAEAVMAKVEAAYGCDVVTVMPHSDDLMTLASAGIFVLRYPEHPLTALYETVADSVSSG
jgi:septum site-determining protein MinD